MLQGNCLGGRDAWVWYDGFLWFSKSALHWRHPLHYLFPKVSHISLSVNQNADPSYVYRCWDGVNLDSADHKASDSKFLASFIVSLICKFRVMFRGLFGTPTPAVTISHFLRPIVLQLIQCNFPYSSSKLYGTQGRLTINHCGRKMAVHPSYSAWVIRKHVEALAREFIWELSLEPALANMQTMYLAGKVILFRGRWSSARRAQVSPEIAKPWHHKT